MRPCDEGTEAVRAIDNEDVSTSRRPPHDHGGNKVSVDEASNQFGDFGGRPIFGFALKVRLAEHLQYNTAGLKFAQLEVAAYGWRSVMGIALDLEVFTLDERVQVY
jgi:hypothetical protein